MEIGRRNLFQSCIRVLGNRLRSFARSRIPRKGTIRRLVAVLKLEIPRSVIVCAYFLYMYPFTLLASSICSTARALSRTSSKLMERIIFFVAITLQGVMESSSTPSPTSKSTLMGSEPISPQTATGMPSLWAAFTVW